ncbi:hypothetical protein MKW98_002317 [Papaver atlanticum]|uniref:Uncharacterized protein n=1 Tax=Papaver atlanticum TaxID=357466 RepID=A0AAD4X3Z6_9MAGN|nr:hypothetical protein MKW98_002317 [Papaver atlanticum]
MASFENTSTLRIIWIQKTFIGIKLLCLILSKWLVDVVLPVPLTVAVDASPLLRKTLREDASAETAAHVPTASVNEENDEDP